ncbi:choice-of-anchor E domain-containing protein [Rhodoferax sp.]|uniref:choice-of-anchor E domain-containing protein n=1 Tax=Rhodoferax sp. TaxID=50421 RepID=UPI00374D9BF6
MKKLLVLCTALLAALPAAQAAPITITQTVTFGDAFAATVTDWNHNLLLPYFDGSLGTLIDAKFTYDGTVTTLFGIENKDRNKSQSFTATARASISFDQPLNQVLNLMNAGSPTLLAKFDGNTDFGGTSGTTQSLSASGNSLFDVTSAAGLAALIGTGNFIIPVHARALSSFSGPANMASNISTKAGADVSVVYTYTKTVPEPGSLALVGLALAGAAAVAKRRKVTAAA